ncbi:unnamed protein product [Lathyrus sativus]|nr:unnamed protein product [Lathyrus sativus]
MVSGNASCILIAKLKGLREKLKWWNKNVFGWVDLRINDGVETHNIIEDEMVAGSDATSEEDLIKRIDVQLEIWKKLHIKESILNQKSRLKWVKDGDSNTRFFHFMVKSRSRMNSISAGVEDVCTIKDTIKFHFEEKFRCLNMCMYDMDLSHLPKLSTDDNEKLQQPFTCEEILEAINGCDGNKSLGPDGFNLAFIKKCWG